jgi:hypothetical protein
MRQLMRFEIRGAEWFAGSHASVRELRETMQCYCFGLGIQAKVVRSLI